MRIDPRRLHGLYAITPEEPDTPRLAERVAAAVAGGARLVQYRAKRAGTTLALEQARALVQVCREGGALLVVNDSPQLARASGADGVHLGREDGSVAAARAVVGHAIVGVSCYADPGLALAAAREGADYVGIGSVFASPTKPGAARAPLAALRQARAAGLPVAAIGGIDATNAREAVAAGADMLAVISALFEAPDVRAAARDIAAAFDERNPSSHV